MIWPDWISIVPPFVPRRMPKARYTSELGSSSNWSPCVSAYGNEKMVLASFSDEQSQISISSSQIDKWNKPHNQKLTKRRSLSNATVPGMLNTFQWKSPRGNARRKLSFAPCASVIREEVTLRSCTLRPIVKVIAIPTEWGNLPFPGPDLHPFGWELEKIIPI